MREWSPIVPGKSEAQASFYEFRVGNGRVLYCPACRRIAVDYGGYYLLFHRRGYDGFLACLQEIQRDLDGPGCVEDVHVGPKGSRESIRLQPGQIGEFILLMEAAAMVMDAECPGEILE